MDKKIRKEILEWGIIIVSAIAIALVVNKFVIYKVSTPTPSMENTVMVGEKVVTFRLAYAFADPKRGDIVVFEAPDEPDEDYLKRIIGLPGETINIKDGTVYVNGKTLKENYLREPMEGTFGPFTVPKGCYFMMGDNRNNSYDSRYWGNKYVSKNKIRGKAIFKYNFTWFH